MANLAAIDVVIEGRKSDSRGSGELMRLEGFHPGWYGAVMGTSIIAIIASVNPGQWSSLASTSKAIAEVMGVVAALLAVVLIVPYVARLIRRPDAVLRDLRDPMTGGLFATVPGGILVLAILVAQVGPFMIAHSWIQPIVAVLAVIGVIGGFAMSLVFVNILFLSAKVGPASANGSWFIPPVVNIVMPLVLLPLMPGASPATDRLLLFSAYFFWGMGFLLFILVAGQVYDRMIFHPLAHAAMAPSTWIILGPIGVGGLALLKMSQAGTGLFGPNAPAIATISLLAATALWGFGLWALGAAVILLIAYLRTGPLPYGIGWWGFTFPLGAFSALTISLARAWQVTTLEDIGVGLFLALVIFWLVVVAGTLRAMASGQAYQRPGVVLTNGVSVGLDPDY